MRYKFTLLSCLRVKLLYSSISGLPSAVSRVQDGESSTTTTTTTTATNVKIIVLPLQ